MHDKLHLTCTTNNFIRPTLNYWSSYQLETHVDKYVQVKTHKLSNSKQLHHLDFLLFCVHNVITSTWTISANSWFCSNERNLNCFPLIHLVSLRYHDKLTQLSDANLCMREQYTVWMSMLWCYGIRRLKQLLQLLDEINDFTVPWYVVHREITCFGVAAVSHALK